MNAEMRYVSNAPGEGFPLELTITDQGEGVLKLSSNRPSPGATPVGMFRLPLKGRQVEALQEILQGSDFASMENPSNVLSGAVVRELHIKAAGGGETVKFAASRKPTPEVFLTAEKLALELAAAVAKKPVQAIRWEVKPLPAGIAREDLLTISVAFSNPGTEAVGIPHPKYWPGKATRIVLNAVRSDIAPGKREPYHQKFIYLTPDDIPEMKNVTKAPEAVTIAAGGTVRLTFQKRLDLAPGAYNVEMSCLVSMLDAQGKVLMPCELVAKPMQVQSGGAGKAGDAPTEEELKAEALAAERAEQEQPD